MGKRRSIADQQVPPYTFGYYFMDGLLEATIIAQVLAFVAALILIIYGTFYSKQEVIGLSILYANSMFLFIKFFGALFYASLYRNRKPASGSHLFIWFLAILLGSTAGTVSIYYLARKLFYSSFKPLILLLVGNALIAFTLSIYAYFSIRLRKNLRLQVQKTEEIKKLQTQAELAAIQSKLNPHFLFNTLNSILQLVYKSPAEVETIIVNLADIYRKILMIPKNGKIPIQDEIELVNKYLQIEKIRMGDRLEFDINVDHEAGEVKIPPLLIEPLVENCIIHGISPKSQGGKVTLSVNKSMDKIVVLLQDNGVGFSDEELGGGFGLYSIQQRITKMYGDNASLKIYSPKTGLTQVKLEIPFEN